MCNKLHEIFEPIPESGEGWKFFFEYNNGILMPLVRYNSYLQHVSGKIVWEDKLYLINTKGVECGFCFFDEKPSSLVERSVISEFGHSTRRKGKVVLKKINYFKGIGKVKENSFLFGQVVNMCLCKEFEILED